MYKERTTAKMYQLIPYLPVVSVGNGWTVSDTVWTMSDIEAVVMGCLKLQTSAR